MSSILTDLAKEKKYNPLQILKNYLQVMNNVGDVLKLNYSEANILVHDYAKQATGGIPHGSFLVATRLNATSDVDIEHEEASFILLRVIGEADLPNSRELNEYRYQAGMRASNTDAMWDSQDKIDKWTKNNISFGGYKCRVLGTFRLQQKDSQYHLKFGADLQSYYSGIGLKVYKPQTEFLQKIINYNTSIEDSDKVRVGRLRYSASEISYVPNDYDSVMVAPEDFLARRTFYCGMSRGGKSNSLKITAKSIYQLRKGGGQKIGQLIFDPNGEYANVNAQDKGCIRNIYKNIPKAKYKDEIATYGLFDHPYDPERKIVKLNFYGPKSLYFAKKSQDEVRKELHQLLKGKEIIDQFLSIEDTKYIKSFRNTNLDLPLLWDSNDQSITIRYTRVLHIYWCALYAAGFKPHVENVYIKNLYSKKFREALAIKYPSSAKILEMDKVNLDQYTEAMKDIQKFLNEEEYKNFNKAYLIKDGKNWADEKFQSLIQIFAYPNGVRSFKKVSQQHSPQRNTDYTDEIVEDLRDGKLVIFDQSTGDPQQNQSSAERIMWAIFNRQKQDFITPKQDKDGNILPPPHVIIYLEEAHNLLPSSGKDDLTSIWARMAKEGSKYNVGMVLATQEPSSVMPAILKNTDNWFIAHLNNTDEIRTINKFYDFEDYQYQIRSISEPGFVRMRTLSNPYTIPVQIDLFVVNDEE